MERDKIWMFS